MGIKNLNKKIFIVVTVLIIIAIIVIAVFMIKKINTDTQVGQNANSTDITENKQTDNKKLEDIKKANQEATAKQQPVIQEQRERAREELNQIEQELKEMAQNQVQ